MVTTLLLGVTGMHWAEFDTTPSLTLVNWVASYVFDPVAITLLLVTHTMGSATQPGRHRWSPLFVAEAAVLGMLGWFMLALPDAAAALWPWRIEPLLAQLYSCFFIAFAVIAQLVEAQVKAQLCDSVRGWLEDWSAPHAVSRHQLDLAATIVSAGLYAAAMEWAHNGVTQTAEAVADAAIPLIAASVTVLDGEPAR